jgi:UDP-glucuronate decarboxylase
VHPIIAEDVERVAATPLPWERLGGATVLVTGAAGMLPAYLVETLLARGALVVGLVRSREKGERRFGGRVELVVQDVCDPLPAGLRADVVIHGASGASPKFYSRDPAGTIDANAAGTRNALDLARRSRARAFLYFSTSEVYGQAAPEKAGCLAETDYGYLDPTLVRSCYAEGKRLGETMCVAWHQQYGVPAVIVRPFHTYGPGMDLDDGRVFADFVADALAGRDIVLKSAGTARRAFCYLADATAGFLTVLLKGEPGQAYNVGNPAGELSVRELAELVAGLSPHGKRGVRIEAPDAGYLASTVSRNSPDIAKVRALGWEPTTDTAAGFRRTIASFR